MLRKGYELKNYVYFILEESQNSLDSKILSSKLFRRYRTVLRSKKHELTLGSVKSTFTGPFNIF
jgi:hypothetical protein